MRFILSIVFTIIFCAISNNAFAVDKLNLEIAPNASAIFRQGVTDYLQNRFESAKPVFEAECENGNGIACTYLGQTFLELGSDALLAEHSMNAFKKGCDFNNSVACNNYAEALLRESGKGNLDPTKFAINQQIIANAVIVYSKSCNLGFDLACRSLARFRYMNIDSWLHDQNGSMLSQSWFNKYNNYSGSDYDCSLSRLTYCRELVEFTLKSKSPAENESIIKEAVDSCEEDNYHDCFILSRILRFDIAENTKYYDESLINTTRYSYKACLGKYWKACERMLINSDLQLSDLPEPHKSESELLLWICNNNIFWACHRYAMEGPYYTFTINLDFTKLDLNFWNTKKEYLEKGCNNNYFRSCYALGISYLGQNGIITDHFQAKFYFSKACDADFIPACFYLGTLYFLGLGTDKDLNKAKQLFENSCNDGVSEGCYGLAAVLNNANSDSDKYEIKKNLIFSCFSESYLSESRLGCAELAAIYKSENRRIEEFALLYSLSCEVNYIAKSFLQYADYLDITEERHSWHNAEWYRQRANRINQVPSYQKYLLLPDF